MPELRLHSKLRENGEIERARDRFHRCSAVRQTDRAHTGAADRIEQRADLGDFGFFFERTEIETDGGSIEELRGGGEAGSELILNHLRVYRADANLCQTDLTETNLECGLARGLGCVHRFDLTPRNDLAASITSAPARLREV